MIKNFKYKILLNFLIIKFKKKNQIVFSVLLKKSNTKKFYTEALYKENFRYIFFVKLKEWGLFNSKYN